MESLDYDKDGFKFGENLSFALTNEIVEKSKSNVDALFATVTFDTRRNGLFCGDALQELDSVGKVLNDELLVSTSESALNASETLTVSPVADVEKVEKNKKKSKKKKKDNSQKNEHESDTEELELNLTIQVVRDSESSKAVDS